MGTNLFAKDPAQRDSIPLDQERFLYLIRDIGVYSRDGQRAVHKPLLILMALAHVQAGSGAKLVFSEIESQLRGLIKEFGTAANLNVPKAHYPFWYLQNDGFWEVENAKNLAPRKGKGPQSEPDISTMRREHVRGGFTAAAYELLLSNPTLIQRAAQEVLNSAFPETLRLDVLLAVGLDGDFILPATKRDARFREEVLRAYSYACAVCGYDGRLTAAPIGIEAAHIRWVQYGGPNRVSNGIAMCSLHHKIFDMGGLTIDSRGWLIVVSRP
jgi:putative restriction endonuclease